MCRITLLPNCMRHIDAHQLIREWNNNLFRSFLPFVRFLFCLCHTMPSRFLLCCSLVFCDHHKQNHSLLQSITTRKRMKQHKAVTIFFLAMSSIECLLCRLVQKAFLALATMKDRIIARVLFLFLQLRKRFPKPAAHEILFPEVTLRCKLPPSKSTI